MKSLAYDEIEGYEYLKYFCAIHENFQILEIDVRINKQ